MQMLMLYNNTFSFGSIMHGIYHVIDIIARGPKEWELNSFL